MNDTYHKTKFEKHQGYPYYVYKKLLNNATNLYAAFDVQF